MIRLICFVLRGLDASESSRGYTLTQSQNEAARHLLQLLIRKDSHSTKLPLDTYLQTPSNDDSEDDLCSSDEETEDGDDDDDDDDDDDKDEEDEQDRKDEQDGEDGEDEEEDGEEDEEDEPRDVDNDARGEDIYKEDEETSDWETDEEDDSSGHDNGVGPSNKRDHRSNLQHMALHQLLLSLFSEIPHSKAHHPVTAFVWFRHIKNGVHYPGIMAIPSILSQLQYGIRVTVLREIMDRHKQSTSNAHVDDLATELLPLVELGRNTVFGWVRNINTVISQAARATAGRPMIQWLSDDGEEFSFEGHPLSHTKICNLVQAMVAKLEESFSQLLTLANLSLGDLPPWERLCDNVSNEDPGYSVFNDPRNQFGSSRRLFLNQLALNPDFCHRVGKRLEWNLDAARTILRSIEEFACLLLAVEYMTGGGPPRGSELCASLYQNLGSRARTLTVAGDVLVNFAGHGKTAEHHAVEASFARAVPRRVAYIQFIFLLIIRPVDEFLSLKVHNPVSEEELKLLSQSHIYYVNRRLLTTRDISRILRRWTEEWFDLPRGWGIGKMRHILIDVGHDRVVMSPRYRTAQDQIKVPESIDLQAGHSTMVATSTYAIPEGGRRYMSPRELHGWITLSDIYHEHFGIKGDRIFSGRCSALLINIGAMVSDKPDLIRTDGLGEFQRRGTGSCNPGTNYRITNCAASTHAVRNLVNRCCNHTN